MNTLLVQSTPYFFQSCRKAHWVLDDVSAGKPYRTVLGQTPGLESDGPEELRVSGCICITNGHEHTAGEVHTVFLPKLSGGTLGVG